MSSELVNLLGNIIAGILVFWFGIWFGKRELLAQQKRRTPHKFDCGKCKSDHMKYVVISSSQTVVTELGVRHMRTHAR